MGLYTMNNHAGTVETTEAWFMYRIPPTTNSNQNNIGIAIHPLSQTCGEWSFTFRFDVLAVVNMKITAYYDWHHVNLMEGSINDASKEVDLEVNTDIITKQGKIIT
jgi:hypothetical protein